MNEPKLVEFDTEDGLTLPGLLYKAKNSKKIAIFLHGNGSSSVFYGINKYKDLPNELNKKNISLLKFNNRGANVIKRLDVKKDGVIERKRFGCAYEIIKECVFDIDGALKFTKSLGYEEFYLIGVSTGANKICVYNHFKSENEFKKYALICGGDDTGIYHNILGAKLFFEILKKSKDKIQKGEGDEISPELLKFNEVFSYQGFYDIANPDGDYNCFPFSESLKMTKLSTNPLFGYFSQINKPSIVIYGENDEYAYGQSSKLIKILNSLKPEFKYEIIKNADHGFTGKQNELAKLISNYLSND